MQDLFEKLMGEMRNAWRFRWQGLVIVWGVSLIGWAVVYSLPNQYHSKAKVHVDTTYMLRPLLRGMVVEPDLNQEVQLLTRTVLSRQNLEKIALNSNLDLGGLTPVDKDQLLERLMHSIEIRSVGNDLYTIGYDNPNPVIAQAVVQQVLNIMMSDALGSTHDDSVTAQKFLKQQLAAYGNELNQAEQKLADFKRHNIGLMPSTGGDYISQLQTANQEKENLENKLDVALSEQVTLAQQINRIKTGKSHVHPQLDPRVQSSDAQIQSDQQKLSNLLTQYTSAYPGVIALKDQIRLEKIQRDKLVEELKNQKTDSFDPNDPVYQKVSMQYNKTTVEIDGLKTRIKLVDALIGKFKLKAGQMANVQAELESMTRNYNITKKQYDSLLSRLYSAKLSQSAQDSGNPLKFQVIDSPTKPLLPSGPKRHLMALLALFAGLAGGLSFAYLLSQIKPVFMTRADLTAVFEMPVIGVIPLAETPSITRRNQKKAVMFIGSVVVFLMTAVVAVLFAHEGAILVRVHLLGGAL
ncbi:hypothetical protein BI364_11715 [Acidihalobacter yilgarnensis]|uniref:Tyrosine kinase G-rich domain-containing protein n=1 Tax=Acidihalobacter yilgarnensis TaxID=2819280 RepID=A0A1D8IQ69_9GAMM|nr:XrtA system polysaccharide chain length determinant [Acidihalobacter yilgarnensis]AOU98534.1 hypothetical protein BI364_11715 [Acidihalobacter yilgarnensis]